ncbi:dihydroorotase [Oscillatoria sp. FACHB-1406]|uniref:dihydroorotase n=1 Tax=Oscillatoria sp. FACHB-1406 TaxID=2692846 RepID=UPI001687380F|nr:dihydroorotase [Oscillatoria sp. FACHB-1406]MBD2580240.1 dihydroorotase [Oscillatoria sp. FACHB-1406]
MNGELLRQVRILDPVAGSDRVVDVAIAQGKIQAIAPEISDLSDSIKVINCQGKILAPGLVDLYSANNEPGREERETLESLAAAALAGGFTRLTLLPNSHPPLDNPATLEWIRRTCPSAPHFAFWGAMTQNLEGKQMTELAELAAAGVIGFADGLPIANLGLLRRIFEYLAPLNQPIALVALDKTLRGNGVMREGKQSIRAGLPGDAAISETAAIASLIEILAVTPAPVHLMRISTARGVEAVAEGKARGLPITASTTWMHLLLDTEDVCSYDPNLRLAPPLGNPEDREALVAGVKAGIIDAIAIDHAPYTYEEKTVPFSETPPGAIGLEFALPLLWQKFVASGEWTALELWRSLSVEPLRCLGQQPQSLNVGDAAELILFDPEATWQADEAHLKSKSQNAYWLGQEVKGRVLQSWTRTSDRNLTALN